jgi:hypothetical protein
LIFCTMALAIIVSTSATAGWWDDAMSTIKSIGGDDVVEEVMSNTSIPGLSTQEIRDAFKQALQIGSDNVVARLGKTDGFNADPTVHIPLPDNLQKASKVLSKVGLSRYADDLELKLNRAAELAAPIAKELFIESIASMSFDDVKRIYEGPNDSATRFFETKMTSSLSAKMKPIVDSSLSEVGAINAYDNLIEKYKKLPLMPDVKADLSEHVISKGMNAIFHYIAKEEAAIRQDPVRQTTDLLKKVFSSK